MVKIDIEYCGYCDFKSECQNLARAIQVAIPTAEVKCRTGRKGAFEVTMGDRLIYSKLKSDDFPNNKEIVETLRKEIKSQHLQNTTCILA